jgi:hypothetical protein
MILQKDFSLMNFFKKIKTSSFEYNMKTLILKSILILTSISLNSVYVSLCWYLALSGKEEEEGKEKNAFSFLKK